MCRDPGGAKSARQGVSLARSGVASFVHKPCHLISQGTGRAGSNVAMWPAHVRAGVGRGHRRKVPAGRAVRGGALHRAPARGRRVHVPVRPGQRRRAHLPQLPRAWDAARCVPSWHCVGVFALQFAVMLHMNCVIAPSRCTSVSEAALLDVCKSRCLCPHCCNCGGAAAPSSGAFVVLPRPVVPKVAQPSMTTVQLLSLSCYSTCSQLGDAGVSRFLCHISLDVRHVGCTACSSALPMLQGCLFRRAWR